MAPLPWAAHLAEFVFHAGPHAAQVDRVDSVEDFGRLVGSIAGRDLDAGVVERHVESAERVDRRLHHGGDIVLDGDVAGDAEDLMACRREVVGGGSECGVVDVGEDDCGPGLGEGVRGGQSHP
jgi:hypothetical protein